MSLPSQAGRVSVAGRSSSNMYRRRRNPKPLLIAGGLVAVIALGGWLLIGRGSPTVETADGAETSAGVSLNLGPQAANAAPPRPQPSNQPPLQEPRQAVQQPIQRPLAQKPPEPAPLELRQGRPVAESGTSIPSGRPTDAVPAPTSLPAVESPSPRPPAPAATPSREFGKEGEGVSLAAARQRHASGDLVAARILFTRALAEARTQSERAAIRADLTKINDDLVFSPRLAPDDPWTLSYTVQPGDSLVRINQRQGLAPDWRLIQRINRMSNPNRLQVGQRLKLLRGPFHAVVTKSAFRLDLYMGPADRPEQWLYIRSFSVGLGEGGSTPTGTFVVKRNSKLINPHWINPRTGQHFAADDPLNPIGEHWIGLEGTGDAAGYAGYGLHGTIDASSIGRELSMGCVRMADEDIALIYELLGEQVSVVRIEP
jgi:hypothetical protein